MLVYTSINTQSNTHEERYWVWKREKVKERELEIGGEIRLLDRKREI